MPTTPKGKKAITFRLADKKIVATKIGADFFSENVSSLPSLTPLSIPLGMQVFYYVDLTGSLNDSQAAIINTYLTATGAKIGIYIPVQLRNYIEYLDWAIAKFGSKIDFFQLDQEKMPISNDEYISRCKTIMGRTQVKCSWNTGLILRSDSYSIAINNAIKTQTGTDSGRQYQHLSDACTWTTDQKANLAAINNYFSAVLPKVQTDFRTRLPNLTKQVILQWNQYNGAELLSPSVNNLANGEMALYTLSNTENYTFLFWQSITNLVSRSAKTPDYNSLARFIPLFKFKYAVPVDITLEGCKAIGVWNDNTEYGLLVTNQSSKDYTITAADIKIKGKVLQPTNFTTDSGGAETIEIKSPVVNNTATLPSATIKKNGVSVITFTKS